MDMYLSSYHPTESNASTITLIYNLFFQGDSGAPMANKVDEQWMLYGIASRSNGCARDGFPAVFTDTCKIRSWISTFV